MSYPFEKEFGEVVSPGHPDKLADTIADYIIAKHLYRAVPISLIGIEVAISLNKVFITGRIASCWNKRLNEIYASIPSHVKDVFSKAGYGKSSGGHIWKPINDEIEVDISGLVIDLLQDGEEDIRQFSDDQSITVGYAVNSPETNYIPRGQWLAWQILYEILELTSDRNKFGPDAKVMTEVESNKASWRLTKLVCSMQHIPGIDWNELTQVAYKAISNLKHKFKTKSIMCELDVNKIEFVINGHGDFSCGGPYGDNGLSGKKLVMDAYGPMVAIGGGAYSGKDPHKVDRVGPVLAREIALHSIIENNLSEEKISLTWAPGRPNYTSIHSTSNLADSIIDKLPKTINGCFKRYFSGIRFGNRVIYDFWQHAKYGWFSGYMDASWEKIVRMN